MPDNVISQLASGILLSHYWGLSHFKKRGYLGCAVVPALILLPWAGETCGAFMAMSLVAAWHCNNSKVVIFAEVTSPSAWPLGSSWRAAGGCRARSYPGSWILMKAGQTGSHRLKRQGMRRTEGESMEQYINQWIKGKATPLIPAAVENTRGLKNFIVSGKWLVFPGKVCSGSETSDFYLESVNEEHQENFRKVLQSPCQIQNDFLLLAMKGFNGSCRWTTYKNLWKNG